MPIEKLFQELGRLHLEVMSLNDKIAALQARLDVYEKPATATSPESAAK